MPTLTFQQFPFGGGFHGWGHNDAAATYTQQYFSPILDSQDAMNLYPEAQAGPDAPMGLIGTPGYTLFQTYGSGPIRALYAGNGKLFVVSGNTVYQTIIGGATSSLGTIGSSTGPCQILANGNDIIIVDSLGGQIYWTNGGAITNPFAGFFAEYMDTFYVALAVTSPQTSQINVSNSTDGSTWPALNFAVRTGVVDFLTGLAAINGQLWLLGQKNTEVWYDAGNPIFPLQRIQGATINVGCMARFSIAKMDNTIYWLGSDDRGFPVVYRANGLQPVRISTPAVERFIASTGAYAETGVSPSLVRAFAYSEGGHNFYVLNFPGYPSVVFDSATGLWHRRAWWNAGSSAFQSPLVATFCSMPATTGATYTPFNLAGSTLNGNVYYQQLLNPADADGSAIRRIRTCPHISNSNRWIYYRRFELDADIINASTGNPSTGSVTLDYSNDGGKTFQNGTSSFTLTPSGASGQGTFQKYYQMNLGRSRKRVFRVTYSSSTDLVRFAGAYVDANPGTEE
jgi:hypothetical protein